MGLPTTFDMDSKSKLMYILPIVSLALPRIRTLSVGLFCRFLFEFIEFGL